MVLVLIYLISKVFIYYCAVRGLLYHLGIKYNDIPSKEKMKELTSMAIERTIKEFLGRV
jgi:hypothetical protein